MVDVSTTHDREGTEQVSRKIVELKDGVVEFEGPPGGPYEPVDEEPPREAVEALQEATDQEVEIVVDDVQEELDEETDRSLTDRLRGR